MRLLVLGVVVLLCTPGFAGEHADLLDEYLQRSPTLRTCVNETATDYALRSTASILDVAHATLGACAAELQLEVIERVEHGRANGIYGDETRSVSFAQLFDRQSKIVLFKAADIAMRVRLGAEEKIEVGRSDPSAICSRF